MHNIELLEPEDVIADIILPMGMFPNNSRYPLLIYRRGFELNNARPIEFD